MQNLTIQKVCLALISLIFFAAAPWLTSQTLEGNALPLTLLASVGLLLLFIYGLGDRCWLLIPFCLSIEGNLNFLPLNFSIQELAIIVVFCYLLFRMIFGLDVAWKLGPSVLWIPLSGVLILILFHWIHSGDIGIKLLGGSGWGGRKYFRALIACLCIPLLASFPGMRFQDLQKVPLFFFLGSFVDIVPDLLTSFVPGTAPIIWKFYSGVNLGEFGSTLQGNFGGEKAITRFLTLSRLGAALGLVILCYYPPKTWLQPGRLWAFPVVLIGGLFCSLSGFRNTIFRYGLSVMAALFCTLRFKSLILLPLFFAAGLTISFTQGRVFDYPLQIQRALAFLPGDWNERAVGETEGSSKWRKKIDELFYKEYFMQAPLIGQGYHFDPSLAKTATDIYLTVARAREELSDEYADVRRFIEMRQPHEGPVHILLVIGAIGMAFFIAYCTALIFYAFSSILKTPPKEVAPIQVWAAAMLLPEVFGFFLVFGDLVNFLVRVCPVVVLLFRFERLKAAGKSKAHTSVEHEFPIPSPEFR
jgi:hypothetical protein